MSTPASSIAGSMPVWRIREVIELAWQDPDAIHLEVGEPDLPTPEHVVDAAPGPQYGQLGALRPLLRARFDSTSGQPRKTASQPSEGEVLRDGYRSVKECAVEPSQVLLLLDSRFNRSGGDSSEQSSPSGKVSSGGGGR
jgi:hypothetical protein